MAAKNASKEHLLPWMPWAQGEPSDLAANLALIRAGTRSSTPIKIMSMASSIGRTQPWWAAQAYTSGSARTPRDRLLGARQMPSTGGSPPRRPRR